MSRLLHRLFRWGVVLKGVDGLVEIASGLTLLFATRSALQEIVVRLTKAELIEDPHDFFANYLVHAFHGFSLSAQHFSGLYLLAHGVIKMVLIVGLLREKLWAFPTGGAFLALFMGYQIFRFTQTHSLLLGLLTVFDLLILFLIWHEYRVVKATLAESARP
ncbi:MAG: DUF2127 domain-containing protein [Chthoniobacterales bacterium]